MSALPLSPVYERMGHSHSVRGTGACNTDNTTREWSAGLVFVCWLGRGAGTFRAPARRWWVKVCCLGLSFDIRCCCFCFLVLTALLSGSPFALWSVKKSHASQPLTHRGWAEQQEMPRHAESRLWSQAGFRSCLYPRDLEEATGCEHPGAN